MLTKGSASAVSFQFCNFSRIEVMSSSHLPLINEKASLWFIIIVSLNLSLSMSSGVDVSDASMTISHYQNYQLQFANHLMQCSTTHQYAFLPNYRNHKRQVASRP